MAWGESKKIAGAAGGEKSNFGEVYKKHPVLPVNPG
jgi:hypothetical protein